MQWGRILVTGGAGFIGSHVVDALLKEKVERVVTLDSFHDFYDPQVKRDNIVAHLKHSQYRLAQIDIRDKTALEQLFAQEQFDAVVHLAARAGIRPSLTAPYDYHETNVTGTLNLLEQSRAFGVKQFIFGSSSSVYGTGAQPPFQEDMILRPISPYAATKAAAELIAHTYSHLYQLRVICLRFFTVYGARQRPDLAIHKFARLIQTQQPIPVYGDGSTARDYTYIDDIVQGILAALRYEASTYEIINLGEAQTVSLQKLIALLENALGKKAIIERLPMQPGDLIATQADIHKAKQCLNYQPRTSIETGITAFANWFLNQASR